MTSQQTTTEKPKYFDLDIKGIGYLNRVRDVMPEGKTPFLGVTISALWGAVDNTQYTRFECIVVGEEAKDLARQLKTAVDADFKVLVGFHLSGLRAEPFVYTQGDRSGTTGVNLNARLLRFQWIKVEGQPFPVPSSATDNAVA
ncbi:MAG: DUF3577 domain-containing protein [Gammaproteobacteria bacterium]|nr:DUF3577 domain-containing protein [Gammaproteobacteria bacterium]